MSTSQDNQQIRGEQLQISSTTLATQVLWAEPAKDHFQFTHDFPKAKMVEPTWWLIPRLVSGL